MMLHTKYIWFQKKIFQVSPKISLENIDPQDVAKC